MATTPTTPEPMTLPPKPEPTPLNPPVMYYNQKWSVPGIMVTTQEEADALDPAEWVATTSTLAASPTAAKDQYPKLMYNVNVEPKIVDDASEQNALGGDWKEFNIPESLIKAAQAKLDAAQSKP